jgi:hypothetical protein
MVVMVDVRRQGGVHGVFLTTVVAWSPRDARDRLAGEGVAGMADRLGACPSATVTGRMIRVRDECATPVRASSSGRHRDRDELREAVRSVGENAEEAGDAGSTRWCHLNHVPGSFRDVGR